MSQSYPIWIDVSGDNYKQSRSFGSRDHVTMDIKVGSSRTYSNDLGRVSIHMREDAAGNREFALAVDGLIIKLFISYCFYYVFIFLALMKKK